MLSVFIHTTLLCLAGQKRTSKRHKKMSNEIVNKPLLAATAVAVAAAVTHAAVTGVSGLGFWENEFIHNSATLF